MIPDYRIVTFYPLGNRYLDRFYEEFGHSGEITVVAHLNRINYLDLFQNLSRLFSRTIYIPILDGDEQTFVPILSVLSSLMRAEKRFLVASDFSTIEIRKHDVLTSALRIMTSIVARWFTLPFVYLYLIWLNRVSRIRVTRRDTGKIAYLKSNLWLTLRVGGSLAHTSGVIMGLMRKGLSVDFISAERMRYPPGRELVHRQIPPPAPFIVPRELNYIFHNLNFFFNFNILRGNEYKFIYQRLSLHNFAGVVLSRMRKTPLIVEYNGSEVWSARVWRSSLVFRRLAELAEEVCLRHAHSIVTVSEVLREELINRGVEPDRVVFYPNGVDAVTFDPEGYSSEDLWKTRIRFGLPKDAVVATFIGTFDHWHGAEIFAHALVQMAKTDPKFLVSSRLHFLFVGDGVHRREVDDILACPELEPFFTMAGLVDQDDVPGLLAASDIFVSPNVPNVDGSRFFGSPTKLFEYLASGRPVVASALDQIGEILKDCPNAQEFASLPPATLPTEKQCGVLVTPADVSDLVLALQNIAIRPEWREVAGHNARRLAVSSYTWEHHVDVILNHIDIVLAAGMAGRPIKILVNALHSKTGGGVTYLQNVLPLLAKKHEFAIHLCIHESQLEHLPPGIENVTLHIPTFRSGFWRMIAWEQFRLPGLARRIGANYVFSLANFGPFFASNSVILLRNSLSVASLERRVKWTLYWRMLFLGTAISLLFCRRAIAVSAFARDSICSGVLGPLRGKASVIHHGVEEFYYSSAEGMPREKFLLAVSDIYIQKNLSNLLLAVAKLCRRDPSIRLVIAGRPIDVDYLKELKNIIRCEDLENNVKFLDHVPKEGLVELYRTCGAFVFPSIIETFGNPLVEAMACGAPIASSRTAAMPEILQDAAIYFDPHDVDDIVATVHRLLSDEGLRFELSERALARSRQFSWSYTAQKTSEIFLEREET